MTGAFSVTLPLPPSANNLFVDRRDRKGRARSSAYKAWQQEAGWALKIAGIEGLGGGKKPWALRIEASVNHARDLGNIEKPVSDLLVGLALVPDDRWLDRIEVVRVADRGDTLVVTAWEMGDSA